MFEPQHKAFKPTAILMPPRNRPTMEAPPEKTVEQPIEAMVHVAATPTAATQSHFVPDEEQPTISTVSQFKAPKRPSVEPPVRTATAARNTVGASLHGELPAAVQPTILDPVATTTLKIPTTRPGCPPLYGTPSATRLVPNEDSTSQHSNAAPTSSNSTEKDQMLAAYLASTVLSFYFVPIHRRRLDFG